MFDPSSLPRKFRATGRTLSAPAIMAALVVALFASPLAAQGLTVRLAPAYGIPLGLEGGIQGPLSFSAGAGVALGGGFLGIDALAPELGLGWAMTDLLVDYTTLLAVEARAGLGASFQLAGALSARAALFGRYAFYRLTQGMTVTSGGSPGVEGELGLELALGERFGLGLGASLGWDFGMFGFVRPYLSAAYRFGKAAPSDADAPARPVPYSGSEAENSGVNGLTLRLAPAYGIPLGLEGGVQGPLNLGASAGLALGGGFLGLDALAPEFGLAYANHDLLADGTSLSAFEARAGLGLSLPLAGALSARAALYGRYAFYRLVQGETVTSGGSPGVEGELGLELGLGQRFGLGLGASLGWDFGMFGFVRPYLSAAYRLGASPAAGSAPGTPVKPAPLVGEAESGAESPAPEAAVAPAGSGAPLEALFEGIFPVYYTYYDENPFGAVLVRNLGKTAWTDLRLTVTMRGVMDSPRVIAPGRTVAPGETLTIPVTALFNDSILAVTEATKLTVDLVLDYREGSRARKEATSVALRVYDRNAMSWADDRSAAAFVTAKDPAILTLAKSLAGAASAARNPAINDKLQLVAAVHDALALYGVNYVADPTGIFSGAKDKAEVDFLQFPRQTLEYRAGDCDDLTILYSAMLEAVGVETAFVTVPGHIFMAASLGLSPADARARFGRVDDLIFRDEKTWLPLEVTLRKAGLLAAWAEGAKQWRESSARGQATFIPVHAAWEAYEPVALPGASTLAALPVDKAIAAMKADVDAFVLREIGERVAKYQAEILKSSNNARAVNSLGLLYAQYGLYDKAKAQFESVIAREEYPAALVNLGNVLKLEGRLESALGYYERAYRKAPTSPQVLLAVARANHEMENYGVVKKYYAELARLDPTLAARYAYLDMKGEEGTRAAEAAGLKEAIEWMEGK